MSKRLDRYTNGHSASVNTPPKSTIGDEGDSPLSPGELSRASVYYNRGKTVSIRRRSRSHLRVNQAGMEPKTTNSDDGETHAGEEDNRTDSEPVKSGRISAKSTVALLAVIVTTLLSFYLLQILPLRVEPPLVRPKSNADSSEREANDNGANDDFSPNQEDLAWTTSAIWGKSAQVWWSGWLTAVATALGVVPFLFVTSIPKYWLGVCNACAAGMMLSASLGLGIEGIFADVPVLWGMNPMARVALGSLLGLIFIIATKYFLGDYEDLKFGDARGVDARKALLVMVVMTVHSFSEGVAIGVSFGGDSGDTFGLFIAATLAVHNIPEGLATSLVLVPHKVPLLDAALWCIFTSLPQPVMAVPAFALVEYFLPILPIGLGFAAGAMMWVALCELIPEAKADAGTIATTLGCSCAGVAMTSAQMLLR
eukprot:gb/GECG01002817.1/.p1 GENE.gb/GECG01002817.1/~~gb/GECG01002817.1/.p1  ORF type:complete len:424 (+),score=32.55 gb/GECG01002817.1/:1-1272(+)